MESRDSSNFFWYILGSLSGLVARHGSVTEGWRGLPWTWPRRAGAQGSVKCLGRELCSDQQGRHMRACTGISQMFCMNCLASPLSQRTSFFFAEQSLRSTLTPGKGNGEARGGRGYPAVCPA